MKDNHYKVFIHDTSIYNLKNIGDIKLFIAMCSLAVLNRGVIKMTHKTRKELCTKTNISLTNISRNLKRLLDAELIFEDEGDYTINPNVVSI